MSDVSKLAADVRQRFTVETGPFVGWNLDQLEDVLAFLEAQTSSHEVIAATLNLLYPNRSALFTDRGVAVKISKRDRAKLNALNDGSPGVMSADDRRRTLAARRLEEKIRAGTTMCSLLDLTENRCRFPLGDPQAQDFAFCGQPVCSSNGKRSSYCQPHHDLSRISPSSYVRRSRR